MREQASRRGVALADLLIAVAVLAILALVLGVFLA